MRSVRLFNAATNNFGKNGITFHDVQVQQMGLLVSSTCYLAETSLVKSHGRKKESVPKGWEAKNWNCIQYLTANLLCRGCGVFFLGVLRGERGKEGDKNVEDGRKAGRDVKMRCHP